MNAFIFAQIVGLAGYALYIASPNFKTRTHMLLSEAMGCAVLCIHFYLIDAVLIALCNMIWVYMGLAGLLKDRFKYANQLLSLSYLLLIGMTCTMWQGTVLDVTVFMAAACAITAKFHKDMTKLRGFSCLGGAFSTLNALMVLSIPGIVFNCLFAVGHARNLIRDVKIPLPETVAVRA